VCDSSVGFKSFSVEDLAFFFFDAVWLTFPAMVEVDDHGKHKLDAGGNTTAQEEALAGQHKLLPRAFENGRKKGQKRRENAEWEALVPTLSTDLKEMQAAVS